MQQVRTATMADRAQIRALWTVCFGDSEEFTDWFFTERYFPSLSSCMELDGEIVCALQSYPLHVRIRDRILPASMLAGVSTHPAHRRKGYMTQVFSHYMQSVRSQGIPVAVHTPAHLPTFFSKGHYPATDTQYVTISAASAQSLPHNVVLHSLCDGLAPLHVCYQRAFAGYSGVVSRSLADFYYKFRDYASDGACCYVFLGGDAVRGYCVFFPNENAVHAEEIAACDEEAYGVLLHALRFAASGRSLTAKLPPALAVSCPGAQLQTRPQGVMGVADVSGLLAAVLGDGSLRFSVQDATVPQNNGVWNGAGAPVSLPPHCTLAAGRLGQLLCGYASVEELQANGYIDVHDAGAIRALAARLPKRPCYIVDEY